MKFYNNLNLIDLNQLIEDQFDNIIQDINLYELHDKSLDDKDLYKFIYHSFLKIILQHLESHKDFNKNCLFVNKQQIKHLKFAKMYGDKNFCLLYKDFIQELKKHFRVITYTSSLHDYNRDLKSNSAYAYEKYFKAYNKRNSTSKKVIDFFSSKGLKHIANSFAASPKLKLYICA